MIGQSKVPPFPVMIYLFYCRIYKHSVITEDMGTFSSVVLPCLSSPSYCYVHFLYEYAANCHGQLLDIRKIFLHCNK